jgi:hypothetical protein
MKIEEGMELEGKPVIIEDCLRADLPPFLKRTGRIRGAEIGVYKGEFTELFCKEGLDMYAIDPWKAFDGQGRTQKVQARQDFLHGHTQRILAPYKNCIIIRKTSADALADFKDGSLDFVYIDGDHTFPAVAFDIFEWSKKVRSGGIVSGHDYFNTIPSAKNILCHVRVIVDAFTLLYNIPNWWLFGRMRVRTGSSMYEEEKKNDRFYSWMWVKE